MTPTSGVEMSRNFTEIQMFYWKTNVTKKREHLTVLPPTLDKFSSIFPDTDAEIDVIGTNRRVGTILFRC